MKPSLFRLSQYSDRLTFKDKAKIFIGALLHPRQTRRWLAFVRRHPVLRTAVNEHPKLISKIYRPYFSCRLGCASRVTLMIDHYRFLLAKGMGGLLARASRETMLLCQLPAKSGAVFQLQLSAIHEGHREGDLCLRLQLGAELVFSASFVFLKVDGQPCVAIGRLQGSRADGARELVRRATREFHGCRPSAVLVHAVRDIGALLGCKKLILVSNRNRVAINLWRRLHISSNYDVLWLELGARPTVNQDFELPCVAAPGIDLTLVASKKRAEARRKAALLDAMHAGLREQLLGSLSTAKRP